MADLSITAANVRAPSGVGVTVKLATVNMEPMTAVYAVNATHVDLANSTNSTVAQCAGVTVTRSYAGQPVGFVGSGTIVAGATINVGQVYVLSPNAGLVCNEADLVTNNYLTVIGYGNNSSTIQLEIKPTGLQHD